MPKSRKADDRANKQPNWRPVSVYLPHKLFTEVDRLAKEARRSLSAQITILLEAQFDKSRHG